MSNPTVREPSHEAPQPDHGTDVTIDVSVAQANKVYADALALTTGERARLAARLIESLEPDDDADVEAVWRVEVARRLRELDEGTVETVDWLEARHQILG